jgi:magnesium and cobalt transporter
MRVAMTDDHAESSQGLGRWLKRLTHAIGTEPRDREELLELFEQARERGLFDADAEEMLSGVLDVAEMQVRDIMVPRPHMVVVERDASPEALLPVILDSGHSRFPVIGDDRDEIVGILLAKDLLRYFARHDEHFSIRDYMRPPVFVPESKRLNVMLRDFRASHNHMAIVVDEYGGVSGLVTIEDVIEQIVGEIDDEHDVEEDSYIHAESDSRFIVKALMPIEDFNEYFGTNFSDETYDTIGGLVMHELGRLPRRGEVLDYRGFRFKVQRASRRRIDVLQVTRAAAPAGLVE